MGERGSEDGRQCANVPAPLMYTDRSLAEKPNARRAASLMRSPQQLWGSSKGSLVLVWCAVLFGRRLTGGTKAVLRAQGVVDPKKSVKAARSGATA